jgi:hypothetical protein
MTEGERLVPATSPLAGTDIHSIGVPSLPGRYIAAEGIYSVISPIHFLFFLFLFHHQNQVKNLNKESKRINIQQQQLYTQIKMPSSGNSGSSGKSSYTP